ncbi:LOW QUALITY PROTEIN: hypothetical protein PanWU01x14_192100 [Parasponia andersonii]|uniref:Uncharacterized protein n=1 Tax=Parasponia andersonii TaxID=3476 RepID=A0A2P5C1E5_PARAD|nr:LOW QUALITY PROTEIN: hypothetical protein PanWU01x14_192100 [Parasponia andersonii]
MASLPLLIIPIFDIVVVVIFAKLKPSESSPATGMVHTEQDCSPRREGSIESSEIGVGISSITIVQRLIATGHFLNKSTLTKWAFDLNYYVGNDYLGTRVTPIP